MRDLQESNPQRQRVERWSPGAAESLSHGHGVPVQDHEEVLGMDDGNDGIGCVRVLSATELNAGNQLRW